MKKNHVIAAIFLVLFILIFFHFKGITYYDEGYILNSALRMVHGQIPYRDFDMVYTPFSFSFTATVIKLFGESILAGRIAAFVVSVFSIIAIYFLLKLFSKNTLLIYGSILFFVSWGPTHINFPWPTIFALCFLLYATLFYLLGIKKKSNKLFVLSGVMTALVFLSKQNFGSGTLFILLVALLVIKTKHQWKYLLHYLLGIISVSGFYFLYLLITGSLDGFIQNINLYTLQRVFVDKSLETPFLYEGPLLIRIIKFFFYTSPLILAITAFFILRKSTGKLFIIPLLTGMFYLLGIRPTTDYVHLVALLALACLPLSLIIAFSKDKRIKFGAICFLVVMTFVGFYTAYFKGYYQWEPKVSDSTYFVSDSRVKIFLTEPQLKEMMALVSYIKNQTASSDYIFVNYYAPMIYFITDRRNPTAYDLISVNQLPLQYQKNIIETLKQKKVSLVVTHEMQNTEKGIVQGFVKENYKITKVIGPYVIYQK